METDEKGLTAALKEAAMWHYLRAKFEGSAQIFHLKQGNLFMSARCQIKELNEKIEELKKERDK